MKINIKIINKLMFSASVLGSLSTVKHCIAEGADNFFDCCHEALFNKHGKIALFFLKHYDFDSKQYKNLYMQAVRFGIFEVIEFVEQNSKYEFQHNEEFDKALHTCIYQTNDLKVLKHFLPNLNNNTIHYLLWVSVKAHRPSISYFLVNHLKLNNMDEEEIFKEDKGQIQKEFSLEDIYTIHHLKEERLKELEGEK